MVGSRAGGGGGRGPRGAGGRPGRGRGGSRPGPGAEPEPLCRPARTAGGSPALGGSLADVGRVILAGYAPTVEDEARSWPANVGRLPMVVLR